MQFTRAKGFDSFCPLGPVDRDRPRPADLRRRRRGSRPTSTATWSRTAAPRDLIFDIPTLIAHVSSVMTLLPGDVILTGTPEGVGPMEVGDEVEVSIAGHRHPHEQGGSSDERRQTRRPRPDGARRPTGSPHVGLARTALYNWAFARHHGGTLRLPHRGHRRGAQHPGVLRRAARGHAVARPRLGRGPAQGRPASARTARPSARDIYADVLARLRASAYTYDCYCTTEEVEARRKASGSKVMGYDGFCRELTDEQVAAFRAEGREPVVRFRMPDGEITFDRPGPRRHHLPDRVRARLRAVPRQRRPALHAGRARSTTR